MSLNFGQNLFPPRGELIQSFDYRDIASGTGIIQYTCYDTKDSSGTTRKITTQTPYSSNIETDGSAVSNEAAFENSLDIDFDLSVFNFPFQIKGTVELRFSNRNRSTGGGGTTTTCEHYIIAKLRKWNGTTTTETEIANVQSQTYSEMMNSGNAGTTRNETLTISIPLTNFKIGENIRLTIEGWIKQTGGSQTNTYVVTTGHDPQNRDGTQIIPSTDSTGERTTKLDIAIPYRINL